MSGRAGPDGSARALWLETRSHLPAPSPVPPEAATVVSARSASSDLTGCDLSGRNSTSLTDDQSGAIGWTESCSGDAATPVRETDKRRW